MLESVVDAYPDAAIDVYVVWVPMIGSDDAKSARRVSGMFSDARVHQYWDPKRRVGTELAENVYPGYLKQARDSLSSLPADHWWRQSEPTWGQGENQTSPLWDIVLFYRPGGSWSESPPASANMVKQIFFYGESDETVTGLLFRDFKKPPRESDWITELRDVMKEFMRGGDSTASTG